MDNRHTHLPSAEERRPPLSAELIADIRRARDCQLGPGATPPFRLSDVKRRQRRAALVNLPLMLLWVASIIAVGLPLRPLSSSHPAAYTLLILGYLLVSFVVLGYCWIRVHRQLGLRCPHCGTTFIYIGLKDAT